MLGFWTFLGFRIEVVQDAVNNFGSIFEMAQYDVAAKADQTAHSAGLVAVINRQVLDLACLRINGSLRVRAYLTDPVLLGKHLIILIKCYTVLMLKHAILGFKRISRPCSSLIAPLLCPSVWVVKT